MKNNKVVKIIVIVVVTIIIILIAAYIGMTILMNSTWNKTQDEINNMWSDAENSENSEKNNYLTNENGTTDEIKFQEVKNQAEIIANYLESQANYKDKGMETDIIIPYTETKMTTNDFEQSIGNTKNYATGYWYIDKNTKKACVKLYPSRIGKYSGIDEVKSSNCE